MPRINGEEIFYHGQSYFINLPSDPCVMCGKPTKFISFAFETRLCPEYCGTMMYFDWMFQENIRWGILSRIHDILEL